MCLISQIADETVINLLVLADLLAASKVKEQALNYIAHNCERVMQTREFKELKYELLDEVTAVIEFVTRKRHCIGTIIDKDRRMHSTCVIS